MFCNYCGAKNPDDAIFCYKCGKRLMAVSSDGLNVDMTILPVPSLPEASLADGQIASGNVPTVPGTPPTPNSLPGQSFHQSAPNAASSVTPMPPRAGGMSGGLSIPHAGQNIAPHFAPPDSSPTWNPQAGSQTPQPQVPSSQPSPYIPSDPHTPHSAIQHPSSTLEFQPQPPSRPQMPGQNQHTKPITPVSHHPHLGTGEIVTKGERVAAGLSRRTVLAGLIGGAGIVAAGSGIALFARSRNQSASTSSLSTRVPSVSSSKTSQPSLAELTVFIASNDGYTYALNASNGSLRWKSQEAGGFGGKFANGVLYTDGVGAFRANDGKLLWSYQTSGQIASGSIPAVSNGYVYTSGGGDGLVHAFRASDGTSIWSYHVDSGPFSSPAVVNGVVYVGSTSGRVYALNASDGSSLWWYQTGQAVESAPTLEGAVLYVGSEDHSVYALNASDGTLLWSYQTGVGPSGFGGVGGSPRVSNGIVYFTADDGYVYALQASNGTLIWRYQMGSSSNDSVALYQGVVYSPSYDHYIYALRASDGTLLWRYQTGNTINSSPAVIDGVVYIGSLDHYVYALRASDGALLWRYQTGGWIQSSPTIGI